MKEKAIKLVQEYGMMVILLMVTIMFYRSCGVNSNAEKHDKNVKIRLEKIDSLIKTIPTNIITDKELKLEGLKVELRMIESTDRKMMDVTRQKVIREEIERLENE